MLEFCTPIERQPRFMEVQAWFQDHESKIMAYLQTVITMLAGILAKWIVQGRLKYADASNIELNTLQNIPKMYNEIYLSSFPKPYANFG